MFDRSVRARYSFFQMSAPQRSSRVKPAAEQITVIVFKDQFRSRSFQVPLAWIQGVGIGLSVLAVTFLTTSFFTLQYFRPALKTLATRCSALAPPGLFFSPRRLTHLSDQAQKLHPAPPFGPQEYVPKSQAADEAASGSFAGATHPDHFLAKALTGDQQQQSSSSSLLSTESGLGDALPNSPSKLLLQHEGPASSKPMNLQGLTNFTSFPTPVNLPQLFIPPAEQLSFSIDEPSIHWSHQALQVEFKLLHHHTENAPQEGKIFLIARGAQSLLAYPPGTLNAVGSTTLFNLGAGEPFSMNRYRVVKAEFKVTQPEDLQSVEIFILNKKSQILLYRPLSLTHRVRSDSE